MNTRSKTQGPDLEDSGEFPSLPQHSAHPLTVLPQLSSTVPVTEFTASQEMMDEASSVMASSQSSLPQPTTSLSYGTASGLVLTSDGDVRTPSPSLLRRGDIPPSSVMSGHVGYRNGCSSTRSTYSRSSRYTHSSRRWRSDGPGNLEETIVQVRSEQARAKAKAQAKAKVA